MGPVYANAKAAAATGGSVIVVVGTEPPANQTLVTH